MPWRLHPTGSGRTTLPVARHIERPPADGHRTALLVAAAHPPPARPRTPASTAGRRTIRRPPARSRGPFPCPQGGRAAFLSTAEAVLSSPASVRGFPHSGRPRIRFSRSVSPDGGEI